METFLCGAAKQDISPKAEWFPFGRSIMGMPFGGLLHPIMVRVIALRDTHHTALLIAFELIGPFKPQELLDVIEEKYGISREYVMMFRTHTHSGPLIGLFPEDEIASRHAQDYIDLVRTAVMTAVDQALCNLRPAKMGAGFGKSYINVNRNQKYTIRNADGTTTDKYAIGNNYPGISDKTLSVIRFDDMQDRTIAFFVNHPTHAVVANMVHQFEGAVAVNGDFPGYTSSLLEEKYEGCIALWSSGPAGDQNPVWMGCWFGPDEKDGRPIVRTNGIDSVDMAKNLAAMHFNDILAVNREIQCCQENPEIKGALGASVTPGRAIEFENDSDFMPEIVHIEETGGTYEIEMQLLTIGDISLIGIGGELYASLGLNLKAHTLCPNPVIVTHNGTKYAGYILDDEAIAHKCHGYERSGIRAGYVKDSILKEADRMYMESK